MAFVVNKRAKSEYTLLKTYVAGLVLSGGEVKSLRQGAGSLAGSFVKILGNEAFLLNAQINPYPFADNTDYDPKRTRKLLLNKKEVLELAELNQRKGITLVPLAIFNQKNMIKLELAAGKGKKEYEKRAVIKERDQKREIAKMMKHY